MNGFPSWSGHLAEALHPSVPLRVIVLLVCSLIIFPFLGHGPEKTRAAPFQSCGSYSVLAWEDILCCGGSLCECTGNETPVRTVVPDCQRVPISHLACETGGLFPIICSGNFSCNHDALDTYTVECEGDPFPRDDQ